MITTMEEPFAGTVLFISPVRQDQAVLRHIVFRTHSAIPAPTCRQALKRLSRDRVAIMLCDHHLPDGSWLDVLDHIAASDDPPLLIVTSRLADERHWAE